MVFIPGRIRLCRTHGTISCKKALEKDLEKPLKHTHSTDKLNVLLMFTAKKEAVIES